MLLLLVPANSSAQVQGSQVVIPAGTLIHCTLSEPNFSSKTVQVGDPVVCPLGSTMLFNHSVFPRGAYLGGHLEAAKEPGHFFGKGYLQIEFDRIGLPDDEIPVPAKVISASNYNVDKDGKIIGHGHATRDTVEWMLPPLWPIKVVTLPARGPRPVLKGEEQFTLRLMDDVALPEQAMPGWHFFGRSSSQNLPTRNNALPARYIAPQAKAPAVLPVADNLSHATARLVTTPAAPVVIPAVATTAPSAPPATIAPAGESLVVLLDGTTFVATSAWVDGSQLSYKLPNGGSGAASLNAVDWSKTFHSNTENGAALALNTETAPH
jgi:hypothetical protein